MPRPLPATVLVPLLALLPVAAHANGPPRTVTPIGPLPDAVGLPGNAALFARAEGAAAVFELRDAADAEVPLTVTCGGAGAIDPTTATVLDLCTARPETALPAGPYRWRVTDGAPQGSEADFLAFTSTGIVDEAPPAPSTMRVIEAAHVDAADVEFIRADVEIDALPENALFVVAYAETGVLREITRERRISVGLPEGDGSVCLTGAIVGENGTATPLNTACTGAAESGCSFGIARGGPSAWAPLLLGLVVHAARRRLGRAARAVAAPHLTRRRSSS